MVDVELVEEVDARAVAPARRSRRVRPGRTSAQVRPAERARGERRGRTRRALGGAVALLLVGTVLTAAQTLGRQREAGLVPVASVADLTAPLREVWRIDAGQAPSSAGDVLLVTGRDAHELRVRAHAAVDGTPRWQRAVPRDEASALHCRWAAGTPRAPLALCQALGGMVPTGRAGGLVQDPGSLLVLDVRDGSVLARHPLPRTHLALDTVDGAVLLARRDGTRVRVERVDPVTLAPAWTASVGVPTGVPTRSVLLDSGGGRVALRLGPAVTLLDAATGERLASWPSPGSGRAVVHLAPHGAGVSATGSTWPASRWLHGDGVLELAGTITEPGLSDGSRPDVVLVTPPWGASVRGVAVADGRVLWSYDDGPRRPVVRHEGVVVLAGGDELRAVDLATGDPRWEVTVPDLFAVHDVTDGTFVLFTGRTLGVGPTVSAISLRDGSLLWRVPMPPGGRTLTAVDDRVLAVGAGVVIGLG